MMQAAPGRSERRALAALLAAGAALSLLFWRVPEIDLAVARWFHVGPSLFVWSADPVALAVHHAVPWATGAAVVALVAMLACAWLRRPPFGVRRRVLAYLLFCLALGPGLAANAILKDNWGRARPGHVVELGGTKRFTPAWVVSDQCPRNCSFVAGDPSAAFALVGLALLARRRRALWVALAGAAGLAVGIVRMAQGGHFLSDVLLAGVIVPAICLALYLVLIARRAPPAQANQARHGAQPPTRPETIA